MFENIIFPNRNLNVFDVNLLFEEHHVSGYGAIGKVNE